MLALSQPTDELLLVRAMYHYARAVAFARERDARRARETDAIAALEAKADFKPYDAWAVPAKAIVQTARLVATGRIADASGDLDGAAKAYEDAIAIEERLSYMEPPYWYYPVHQSLGSAAAAPGPARRRRTRVPAIRSCGVRNNGWAIAGLAEVYQRKGDRTARRRRSARIRARGSGRGRARSGAALKPRMREKATPAALSTRLRRPSDSSSTRSW